MTGDTVAIGGGYHHRLGNRSITGLLPVPRERGAEVCDESAPVFAGLIFAGWLRRAGARPPKSVLSDGDGDPSLGRGGAVTGQIRAAPRKYRVPSMAG
jgi:hypothetical protein